MVKRKWQDYTFIDNLLWSSIFILSSITDRVKYEETNFAYIDYISDTIGNEISITRDSNGYVTSIVAPGGKTTHFEYDSNNNLSLIKYPDNRRAIFGYNNGMLNLIRDSDGYEITLEYSNDDTKSVKKVQEGVMKKGVYTEGQRIIFDRSILN